MTNRLELNWKLDGFVDEQRYYCSETTIDPENLPVAKAVLTGAVRNYVDTDIEISKTYYVRVSSIRNGVEKLSQQSIITTGDAYTQYVKALLHFDGDLLDVVSNTVFSVVGSSANYMAASNASFGNCLNVAASFLAQRGSSEYRLGSADFTFECRFRASNFNKFGGVNPALFSLSNNHTSGTQELLVNIDSDTKLIGMRVYEHGYIVNERSIEPLYVDTEYTMAFCRKGSNHYLFINGLLVSTKETVAYTLSNVDVILCIGAASPLSDRAGNFNGLIDEFRFTKGVARYTENYIPSNIPFSL